MTAEKPILYIMCGLPFSGKSTLARKISEIKGNKIVEIDEIKTNHGLRDEWQTVKPEEWQKIFAESFEQVKNELSSGKSVVHDSANQTLYSRNQLRDIAKECDRESRVIFIEISQEDARARWQHNKNNPTRMDLPEWAFNAAVSNYEIPTNEPDVLVYEQSDDPEEWIGKTL